MLSPINGRQMNYTMVWVHLLSNEGQIMIESDLSRKIYSIAL